MLLSPLLVRIRDVVTGPDRTPAAVLGDLLPLLAYAALEPPEVLADVVAIVRAAQPLCIGLQHACEAAATEAAVPGTLAAFGARVERAPRAIARVTREWLQLGASDTVRLVTLDVGDLVTGAVAGLSATGTVEVSLGEGRPSGRGRTAARRLREAGARVTLYTDAGVAAAVAGATALLVETSVVTPMGWVGPVGLGPLAAWARRLGVPVVILASPETLAERGDLLPGLAADLAGAPATVWDAPPDGVQVRVPVVETVPLDLADVVISDRGPVLPADLAHVAAGLAAERRPPAPVRRGRGRPRRRRSLLD